MSKFLIILIKNCTCDIFCINLFHLKKASETLKYCKFIIIIFFNFNGIISTELVKLVKLEIVNCARLLYSYLAEFVENSSSLKELILYDCTAYDREMFVARLLAAVFTEQGTLVKFSLSYSKPSIITVLPTFQPDLQAQHNLEYLDISNNTDFKFLVREIVHSCPNLRHINVIGLPIEHLNLMRYSNLITFKSSYYSDSVLTIRTIRTSVPFDEQLLVILIILWEMSIKTLFQI